MMGNTDNQVDFPIIDSHIHLYAQGHIKDLAWTSSLPSTHVLKRQNSVVEYRAVTASQPNLVGFVFVETDRISSLSEDGWTHALEEIDFLWRIRTGSPRENEGHTADDKSLLLGGVPWAPLPADPPSLVAYLDETTYVQSSHIEDNLIRGFRYLLQDKPPGTQLKADFVQNLLLLEERGFKTFDLGIDFHRNGPAQLQESLTMLNDFYKSSSKNSLNIVLNHLCKPDLTNHDDISKSSIETFDAWATCIHAFAQFPTTYMKLSGLFSEMPPQDSANPKSIPKLLEHVRPYVRTIFESFGANRIMFGSDWPVCNVGGPGPEKSWQTWVDLVAASLDDMGCTREEKAQVWAGTANRVYGLGVDLSSRA